MTNYKKKIKYLILIKIVFLCTNSNLCHSQELISNYSENSEHKIKVIIQEEFKPIYNGDSIVGERIKNDNFLMPKRTWHFNNEGQIIKEEAYNVKNDIAKLNNIKSYYYSGGQLDSVKIDNLSKHLEPSTIKYLRTSNDTTVNIFSSWGNSRKTLSWRKGNVRYEERYSFSDTKLSFSVFSYDSKERLVKAETFRNDTLINLKINTYITSDSFDILNSYTIDLEKNQVKRTHTKYNEFGDVIEKSSYNYKNNLQISNTYKYTYDQYNNWIRKERYGMNDRLLIIFNRIIEYY